MVHNSYMYAYTKPPIKYFIILQKQSTYLFQCRGRDKILLNYRRLNKY